MKVKCIDNNIDRLDKKLSRFAFGQNETGVVDITIGNEYDVYGIRKNQHGNFYLVTTDEVNKSLPWWIPAGLFTLLDEDLPVEWIEKRYGLLKRNKEVANQYYFGHELDIEDGTEAGYRAFGMMQRSES